MKEITMAEVNKIMQEFGKGDIPYLFEEIPRVKKLLEECSYLEMELQKAEESIEKLKFRVSWLERKYDERT